MRSSNCAKTQRLAVGVCLPTDCGQVLPRSPLAPQMTAWCGLAEGLSCHVYPSWPWELVPNQRPKPLRIIGKGGCLLYFPL